MPFMTPGDSLTGIGNAQQAINGEAKQKLTGNGKDLLILSVISTGIAIVRWLYLSFY